MSNSETLLGRDPSAKLDTGMTVSEAIKRTRDWWQSTGRGLMLGEAGKRMGQFSKANPDDANFIPSGIINGLEWDALDTREKLRLVKFWHHFHVRMQDVIGSEKHLYEFGKRDTIQ